jgi:hypothetical protein
MTASEQTPQKTPYELAHEAFDQQAAVVNAQMGFVHAMILPPRHINTDGASIQAAHDLMAERFETLRTIAESAGAEVGEDAVAKFQMLTNSYGLFANRQPSQTPAFIVT